MANVLGVGGVFFECADVDATRDWYARVLGITMNDYGGADFLHADSAKAFPIGARTIWSPFAADNEYFKPSKAGWMLNLIVDDLDAMIARIKSENVPLQGEPMTEPYGHFAWIMDPDGRKIELWQPIEPPADAT
ncbi:MAG: VOC family protein [Pseudomonadota bacterium]